MRSSLSAPARAIALASDRAETSSGVSRCRATPRETTSATMDGDSLRIRCAHCDAVFGASALPYDCDARAFRGRSGSMLMTKFVRLDADERARGFLGRARARGREECERLARACTELRRTMSLTEANAALGRGKMHVLSSEQAETLLGRCGESLGRRWFLDVGAGCGEVTEALAGSFEKTCATESSPGMAARLRERGFSVVIESDTIERVVEDARALGGDVDEDGFDVVAALNLVDRVRAPKTLLTQLRRALKPKVGILILAIVVPFRPFVENADGTRSAPAESERLDVPSSGSWEAGVEALWSELIAPLGFELVALSRVPYISEGDHLYDAYVLDDAVFVLRAP